MGMGCEELSLQGLIDEIKDVSIGPHPRKFCFVLGAGASRSSGIKSGQELVDIWDEELTVRNRAGHAAWKKNKDITDENKYSFYSEFYDRRFSRESRDGYNYLEKLMENAKPSAGYVMLAHILSQTKHNVVITTNFDHLIEDAVNYYSQVIPLVIGHESLAHYISAQITRPTIVKIHRDLLLDPKSRTSELKKLHPNWEDALGFIFKEYHPVFIGYAGNDDSLMDFLLNNNEKFKNGEWRFPYWMLYKTDKLDGKILEFIDGTNGYYIRHDGFDQTLYLLGTAFDYKVPSEETFLSDARKRYQSLSNAIDKFTESYSGKTKPRPNSPDTTGSAHELNIDYAIRQVTDQSELLEMYRRAVALHNAGEYDSALKIKQDLVDKGNDNALYFNSLGATLYAMGRYEEALVAFEKAVDLEPNNARYLNGFGATLHEMGRYEEALAASQKAVDLEPNNAQYLNDLGTTLHAMHHYERALEAEHRAVDLEPYNAQYQYNLGATLHNMGRYKKALVAVQKAVDLKPNNAQYQGCLGATFYEMNRYEEALAATQKAVDLEPSNAQYQNDLSNILHAMGRYEEALAATQKAVDLEPNNAWYQNSLGATLYAMGRYKEALVAVQKAVDLEPNNAKYSEDLEIVRCKIKPEVD